MIYIESGAANTDVPVVLYDNILLDGTLTGTEASGFPKENAVTGTTWDYWQAPDAATRSIGVDLSSQTFANCLFVDAHDIATVGADIKVQYSTDGGSVWQDASDWYTPTDNTPIMILFSGVTGNSWRMQTRNGPPKIGVIMLGNKLPFEYGTEDMVSFRHGERTEVMGGNSIGGQFLGQKIRRKGGNTSFSFPWLTADWVNNDMAMFEAHYNDGKPFGMALRPSYDADELAYCWRPDGGGELRPQYQMKGVSFSMNMQVDYYVS